MIVQNAVVCLICGDYIFSSHRHHYVQCTCGTIAVDGGQEYLRRVGHTDMVAEMSWSLPDDVYEKCVAAAEEARTSGRNSNGVANAVMRALRKAERIIAEGECKVIAENKDLDEIMVVDGDGNMNRYKKVIDNGLE